jgi:hypothetical protein
MAPQKTPHQVRYLWKDATGTHRASTVVFAISIAQARSILSRLHPHITIIP